MSMFKRGNAIALTCIALAAFLGLATRYILPARAGVACTLPFTLTNGTIADATQVMANYNAIVTCLGNAASAGVNSDITTLAGLTTPLNVAQGGTGQNSQTTNGIAYYTGSVINTNRCTMDSNQSIACTSGGAFLPQVNLINSAADVSTAFLITSKNRAGGNTLNGDGLGSFTLKGFANGAQQNSASFSCSQSAASVGSNIPSSCAVTSSDQAGAGQLNITFKFPTNNGVSGQSLITDGAGVTSWGRPATDIQVFTATGANTWTRAAGVTWVQVRVCGGGGGGGGGSRVAAATASTGGAGGGGGYCAEQVLKAADAGASQTVTIATGGTNGSGATINGNAGTSGAAGGNSTFGTLITGFGGGGGEGGQVGTTGSGGGGGGSSSLAGQNGGVVVSGVGGGSGFGFNNTLAAADRNVACAGGNSNVASTTFLTAGCPFGGAGGGGSNGTATAARVGNPGGAASMHGPGGGGGGSQTTDNVGHGGAAGGVSAGCPTGGAAGGVSGAGGSTAALFNYLPGCGGGGGGSSGAGAGAGGAGTSSGGGGGGGAGDNVNGGNGATGGNGFALVVSW